MPSLRKRVTSYIRQLSFHNEPREKRQNINENSFVTKYLQGQIKLKEGPPVISGKQPTDLPNYDLATYAMGAESIIGCYTGPNGGLTTVKRTEKHLSVMDPDIDFIDTQEEHAAMDVKTNLKSRKIPSSPIDNTTMIIKVAGQEYFVTNRKEKVKSQSMGSLSDLNTDFVETKDNNNKEKVSNGVSVDKLKDNDTNVKLRKGSRKGSVERSKRDSLNCDSKENDAGKSISSQKVRRNVNKRSETSMGESKHINAQSKHSHEQIRRRSGSNRSNSSMKNFDNKSNRNSSTINSNKVAEGIESKPKEEKQNYALSKSKSEGNPFQHRKRGKIIKLTQRPTSTVSALSANAENGLPIVNDLLLPPEWQRCSDHIYGISDSLYDKNQVTKLKNGDPIADCFGIIARRDSAILAVADGVNWGEKACIAAKSAIHGCLHYLNKTIFNDTKPFENLIKSDAKDIKNETPLHESHMTNTQEVFVCLLRAFNCAHDLILENNGMLTTLTVAVVLPLRQGNENDTYACCVCNVGDTLAYIYSQKYGVRELTKGSHDIQSNRDMRDALGALGPVDGTNPELSNLTLSITKVHKGDIVLLASDGLTDNFDSNVCKFTVNSNLTDSLKGKKELRKPIKPTAGPARREEPKKAPIKPPRKNYVKDKSNSVTMTGSLGTKTQKVNIDTVDNVAKSEKSTDLSNLTRKNNNTTADQLNDSNNDFNSNVTQSTSSTSTKTALNDATTIDNPLIAQFLRENSIDEHSSSLDKCRKSLNEPKPIRNLTTQISVPEARTLEYKNFNNVPKEGTPKYNFLRSKTSLDLRIKPIQRNEDGLPFVTPIQRYELTLLLMEDILKHGLSGRDSGCVTARKLCENLMRFTFSITAAKRRTLEDNDLYFDNQNGLLIEVSAHEKKIRRKKGLEKVQSLPGKLDHVSVVAYNIGNFSCVS